MTRWLRIGARTVHLVAMAWVLVEAYTGALSGGALALLVASGAYIVGDDFRKHGVDLLRYTQFWAVVVKVGLLAAVLGLPQHAGHAALAALVVGSVISHSPGRVRQAALFGAPGPCAEDPPTDP